MLLASQDKLYLCNLNVFAMARPFHLLIYSLFMVALLSCNRQDTHLILSLSANHQYMKRRDNMAAEVKTFHTVGLSVGLGISF